MQRVQGNRLPDDSSIVICDRLDYLRNESIHCRVQPRRQARHVARVWNGIGSFTVTARTDALVVDGNVQADNGTFVVWAHHVQHDSTPLFDVHLRLGDVRVIVLPGPKVRIWEMPDETSIVQCPRAHLVLYEKQTCSVLARRNAQPIATLARAFVLQASSSHERIDPLSPALGAASVFTFGYTVVQVTNDSVHSGGLSIGVGRSQPALTVPLWVHVHPPPTDLYRHAKRALFHREFMLAIDLLTIGLNTGSDNQRPVMVRLRAAILITRYVWFSVVVHACIIRLFSLTATRTLGNVGC